MDWLLPAGCFAAFSLWAWASLLLALVRQPNGTDFTLVNGPFVGDQMQYLAWVREFSQHLLVSSPYLGSTSHADYFQPMFALSGLVVRTGLSPAAAYLLWLPVCVLVMFVGVAAYVRRALAGRTESWVAAGLALLSWSPTGAFVALTHLGSGSTVANGIVSLSGEATSSAVLWGYFPSSLAVGLVPICFLCVERLLTSTSDTPSKARRHLVEVAGLAALISWLHPWQGEVVIGCLAGLCVWSASRRQVVILTVPLIAGLVPLGYYWWLDHTDPAWRVANALNHGTSWPLVALVVALIPIGIGAFFAGGPRPGDVIERTLFLWPVAAILVYLVGRNFPPHALEGISIPFAVLAVRAFGKLSRHWRRGLRVLAATVLFLLFSLPGRADAVYQFGVGLRSAQPYYLNPDEISALRYLARVSIPGSVMTSSYLGTVVPAYTGRRTWVGDPFWQADYTNRARQASALFAGRLTAAQSQGLVWDSGVTFLLSDCQESKDLTERLGPLLEATSHFGCATIYQLLGRPDRNGPAPAEPGPSLSSDPTMTRTLR